MQWPTTANFDRELTFTSLGGGRYEARLGALEPGRWRLRARAEGEAGALDFESELTWPS
jgi:nitrogen fixation protein FixH